MYEIEINCFMSEIDKQHEICCFLLHKVLQWK